MKYSEARGSVEDGDVLHFESRGLVAHVIRWATRSRFSHVGLAVWIHGRLMVAESRELRGCRLIPLSSALVASRAHLLTPALWANLDRGTVVDAALQRLGQPYGYLRLVRIALSKLPTSLLRKLPVVGPFTVASGVTVPPAFEPSISEPPPTTSGLRPRPTVSRVPAAVVWVRAAGRGERIVIRFHWTMGVAVLAVCGAACGTSGREQRAVEYWVSASSGSDSNPGSYT